MTGMSISQNPSSAEMPIDIGIGTPIAITANSVTNTSAQSGTALSARQCAERRDATAPPDRVGLDHPQAHETVTDRDQQARPEEVDLQCRRQRRLQHVRMHELDAFP